MFLYTGNVFQYIYCIKNNAYNTSVSRANAQRNIHGQPLRVLIDFQIRIRLSEDREKF